MRDPFRPFAFLSFLRPLERLLLKLNPYMFLQQSRKYIININMVKDLFKSTTAHSPQTAPKQHRSGTRDKLSQQKTIFQKLIESEQHMAMVFSYCGVFLLYGMTDELLGPTLIELSCLAAEPLKTMSWLFFSHDVGLLVGTLFGGFIVSR